MSKFRNPGERISGRVSWRRRFGVLAAAAVVVASGSVSLTTSQPAAASAGFGPGAVSMARYADGRLALFASDSRDEVWYRSQKASITQTPSVSAWGGWVKMAGSTRVRSVAAETNADGRVELFGLTGSGGIFHRRQTAPNSSEWTDWTPMDGTLQSVTVARNADGRLEVFGAMPNHDVYHRIQQAPNSNDWSNWELVNGAMRAVAAETNADGRLEVVGVDGDGAIWHTYQQIPNVNSWSGWLPLDGAELSSAVMARSGGGALELWTTNRNGSIYGRHQNAPNSGTWSPWTWAGASRSLAAETNLAGYVELVAVGTDGDVWHRTQIPVNAGSGTSSSWSSWESFGSLMRTPDQVSITSDAEVEKFVEAVGQAYTIVRIAPDVNLNLTAHAEPIQVAWGVQIIGERTAEFPKGPRLFITSNKDRPGVLLKIGDEQPSDNVRISGIRLDGGLGDRRAETEEPDAHGIEVNSSRNVEIDNSEMFGWSGAAVRVEDFGNRLDKDHQDLMTHVHDNYIHHNQHDTGDVFGGGHGNGYGVHVGDGAYAFIEKNLFDYNRHAVAGDGAEGTGFIFKYNMIGTEGGKNTPLIHTHQIDMHGTQKCTSGYDCGPAGEYMEIAYNRIYYTQGTAIKLRGTPSIGMDVHHNVFDHTQVWGHLWDLSDGALYQTESGLREWSNTFGAPRTMDTWRDDVCDFDGDGAKDFFGTDSVLWWYFPGGDKTRPEFMRQSTTLAKDVTKYSDYNGDGFCDVFVGSRVYLTAPPT